jgi:DNA-binding MarR family transcriptional regulator
MKGIKMNDEKVYELIKELTMLFKLLNRKISHKVKDNKVNIASIMILQQVKEGQHKALTEIAENLGLPNSTTSVLVDKLVKQGILNRVRDEEDRRKVIIYATEKAALEEQRIREQHIEHLKKLISPSNDEETETILKGLEVLIKVIERGEKNN